MRINNFREVNSRSIGGDDVFLKMSCCGCSACLQKCPKKCIEMHEDAEGFLYPEINDDFCIDCGICYNVCPVKIKSLIVNLWLFMLVKAKMKRLGCKVVLGEFLVYLLNILFVKEV